MDREGDLTKKPTSSPSVEDRFVLENSGHRVSFFFNGSLSVLFLFFFSFSPFFESEISLTRREAIRLFFNSLFLNC